MTSTQRRRAFGDLVELLLHPGREAQVNDLREVVDQQAIHHLADVCRGEPLVLAPDVAPLLDGRQDRGIGGGPPDPVLLQGLDERGLCVAGRRLGEMLLREEPYAGSGGRRRRGRQTVQPQLGLRLACFLAVLLSESW